jgi:hypothetical protein
MKNANWIKKKFTNRKVKKNKNKIMKDKFKKWKEKVY